MLSGVLNSAIAVRVSIRIMETFVAMRKALASIAPVMARLAEAERRQLEDRTRQIADQARNEERFDTIFKAMDGGDFPLQGRDAWITAGTTAGWSASSSSSRTIRTGGR